MNIFEYREILIKTILEKKEDYSKEILDSKSLAELEEECSNC